MSGFPNDGASLDLGWSGHSWADLHDPQHLRELHSEFERWLAAEDADAAALLARWAAEPGALRGKAESAAIVRLAPFVGRFVARLFGVEAEVARTSRAIADEEAVFAFRKHVAKKRVLDPKGAAAWTG